MKNSLEIHRYSLKIAQPYQLLANFTFNLKKHVKFQIIVEIICGLIKFSLTSEAISLFKLFSGQLRNGPIVLVVDFVKRWISRFFDLALFLKV